MNDERLGEQYAFLSDTSLKEREEKEKAAISMLVLRHIFPNREAQEKNDQFRGFSPYGHPIAFSLQKTQQDENGAHPGWKVCSIVLLPIPFGYSEPKIVNVPKLPLRRKGFFQRLKAAWVFLWKGEQIEYE